VEDTGKFLPKLKEALDSCGFVTTIQENIQQLIWDKMFTNVSLSAVTAILSVEMGFIAANEHAWYLTECLVREAAAVARGMGLKADDEKLLAKVRATSEGSPNGVTSICADIRAGRKTEVDTISGSVVRAAQKAGVRVPTHEFVVNTIHALEGRPKA
jgi:2-dehydropantoate 2-reductase